MAKKSSLVALAKGNKTTIAKKSIAKVEKPKTVEEERDIKAKQKVEELLQDVDLTKKSQDLLELEPPTPKEGIGWLEEQVTLLTAQVDELKSELVVAKDDYGKLFNKMQNTQTGSPNDDTVQNITTLYTELQNNLLGNNQEKTSWSIVNIVYLLNRLHTIFPFTLKLKRF